MEIREYREEDCPEMARLFYDTVHEVNCRDYPAEQLDVWATGRVDLTAWNRSFLEHDTLVAIIDGEMAGFGDLDGSYLDRLYAAKNWQGAGVGAAITNELERRAAAAGCDKITTHASITAKPFFEKRGYLAIREQQVERDGIYLKNFVMEKQL